MSYNTMADMRVDPRFNSRVQSSIIQEAQARPISEFTEAIKLNAMSVGALFVTLIHTDPAISDAYEQEGEDSVTDEMILGGVRLNWDEVESLWRQQTGLAPLPPVDPAAPTIIAIDPIRGTSGTTVTITGTTLSGTTSVTIDGYDCVPLTVVSDTEVTVVTPAGPHKGTYPVLVTVDGIVVTGSNFQVT
jgi:IPT/TIG domain-containing protein